MSEQTLFYQARARSTDPETSHQAAKSVVNLGQTRDAILAILGQFGPMSDEELVEVYINYPSGGMASESGLRSRRSELVKMGFVEAAGTGKTASGRPCTIWSLVKK